MVELYILMYGVSERNRNGNWSSLEYVIYVFFFINFLL